MVILDRIDKQILSILQTDCSISNQDLADKIALSPSPCLRRVKQLHDSGYIKKQVALLEPKKIGLGLTVVVSIGLGSHEQKKMALFEKEIKSYPEVVNCLLIAGQQQDYLLTVLVKDLDSYQKFLLNKLTQINGVTNIHSNFVLKNIVDKTELPLT